MAAGKGDNDGSGYVVLRSERRKDLRRQILVLKIRGIDDRGAFFGYAKSLGTGGMFIASVNPREVGEQFAITFSIPRVTGDVRCSCEVVWRREYDPKKVATEPGMGIKFLDMDNETKGLIEGWLARL